MASLVLSAFLLTACSPTLSETTEEQSADDMNMSMEEHLKMMEE